MISRTRIAHAITAALLALALAACGDDAGGTDGTDGMDGMDGMEMNDSAATPADEVDGDLTSGDFAVLDTAPPGSDGVSGEAFVAQTADGTTVTIRLTGLQPDTDYMSHLHAEPCAPDSGGDHFRFDPAGSDLPPNEVHLSFTSSSSGEGEATVTNERRVEGGAPSVVVHPAEAMDNKLACADLS